MIETVDHEFQEIRIPQRLSGNVDRDAAARRQLHAAAPERGQHGLHYPAVDVRHQPIALGRADEIRGRRTRLAVLATKRTNTSSAGPRMPLARACTMGW